MREKILVNKKDKFRTLHTELLPYEVPILFNNTHLYNYHASEKNSVAPLIIRKLLSDDLKYSIPFDYEILQGSNKRRVLSIIHPNFQAKFPDIYNEFNEIIISLCKKSEYSLRFPSRLASHFYEREFASEDDGLRNESVDEELEPFSEQPTHASSFFSYAKYSQLHKFIDSQEFLDLELRFSNLMKFDLKRCFNSIYTHSISWAIKGKNFSKDNLSSYSFDSKFDALMQRANYNETNGIVIGPEISRIFSEIILQQIDLDIATELNGLGVPKESFAIRRYVDDYYVFTENESLADTVLEVAQACLRKYKLYINESKTERLTAPFVTPQTTAKKDVQEILGSSILAWLNHLKKLLKDEDKAVIDSSLAFQLKSPYRLAAKLTRDIKIAIKRSNVSFDIVTGYALNSITRSMYRLLKSKKNRGNAKLSREHQEIFQNVILVCTEVVFFFCSMDFRVRTTYLISQYMLLVSRLTKDDQPLFEHLAYQMCNHVDRICNVSTRGKSGVEIYNLLIATKIANPDAIPGPQQLLNLTTGKKYNREDPISSDSFCEYTYFDYVAMLFLASKSQKHRPMLDAIEKSISERFQQAGDFSKDTQMTLLFIDVISCPHIAKATKKQVTVHAYTKILRRVPPDADVNQIINFVTKNLRFFDWSATVQLEKLLLKKQLNPAY